MCPSSSPAALPCGVRQRRGGARLKDAAGGNRGSTRNCPRFRSRREPRAPDPTYAQSRSSGCRCELELAPTQQVSASGSTSSEKPGQVKVCPLFHQICGSRGWRVSPGGSAVTGRVLSVRGVPASLSASHRHPGFARPPGTRTAASWLLPAPPPPSCTASGTGMD